MILIVELPDDEVDGAQTPRLRRGGTNLDTAAQAVIRQTNKKGTRCKDLTTQIGGSADGGGKEQFDGRTRSRAVVSRLRFPFTADATRYQQVYTFDKLHSGMNYVETRRVPAK
jgi:hypothetical protein